MRLKLTLAVFALGALIAFWPVPRVDLTPIQRKPPAVQPRTSIGTAWSLPGQQSDPTLSGLVPSGRPSRPAHPASIYMPKALR
jgi:hypothetical protein